MKYVYLVYMYMPKHKAKGVIYEGHYLNRPRIYTNLKAAKEFQKKYKHASYIRWTALHD